MVKGTQRQMIMVRTPESEIFEMAYLMLRAEAPREVSEESMIDEANGLVSSFFADNGHKKRERRRQRIRRIVQFSTGALFGSFVLLAVMMAIKLL